jgi:hypothetical protein
MHFGTYLGFNKSQVRIRLTNKAKHKTVNWFGYVKSFIMLNKECLKFVIVECLASELNKLVADVGKYCCLRMDSLILATFSNYTPFNVAKETMNISKNF